MKTPYDPAQDPKVRQRLSEYVAEWMKYNGWNATQMAAHAVKLQVSEGVSDANIGNILSGKPFKMSVYTLRNFSITLGRPPKELFEIAIGEATQIKTDLASKIESLWEIYSHLPNGEQKYFERRIRSMIREMCADD